MNNREDREQLHCFNDQIEIMDIEKAMGTSGSLNQKPDAF